MVQHGTIWTLNQPRLEKGGQWIPAFGLRISVALILLVGCAPLQPKSIQASRVFDSPQLHDGQPQIQRGEPRKVIDTVGWVFGIPSKLVLWNRHVENHRIGPETELAVADYLEVNGLETVRVRLNQYHPRDDWSRLVRNKSVGPVWRYTIGTISVLGETLLPGRLFGGDHFNPYTNTIHLYSDVPAIALHEGAHSKDFARRKWKGSYAAVYTLPIVPLYHESVASADVMAYLQTLGNPEQRAAACRILYPAYGTYVGSALGNFAPATPVYLASVLTGHAVGWRQAKAIEHSARFPDADSATAGYAVLPAHHRSIPAAQDVPCDNAEVYSNTPTQ
jgi:hypothetical protein